MTERKSRGSSGAQLLVGDPSSFVPYRSSSQVTQGGFPERDGGAVLGLGQANYDVGIAKLVALMQHIARTCRAYIVGTICSGCSVMQYLCRYHKRQVTWGDASSFLGQSGHLVLMRKRGGERVVFRDGLKKEDL